MLFAIKFTGLYPVGAVSLVNAENKKAALTLFKSYLETYQGGALHSSNQALTEEDVEKVDVRPGTVHILLDGEY